VFMAVAFCVRSGVAPMRGSLATSNHPPILFAGGVTKKSTLASAELFEPNHGRSGAFVATGSMSTARVGHTATVMKNGLVLIAGGGQ